MATTRDMSPYIKNIQGKPYMMVNGRVLMAHDDNPDVLSIETELLSFDTERDFYAFRAIVTTKRGKFVGHSVADAHSKGIAGQAPCEVAETSAIGRALGVAGYAIEDGIASVTEIEKTSDGSDALNAPPPPRRGAGTPVPITRNSQPVQTEKPEQASTNFGTFKLHTAKLLTALGLAEKWQDNFFRAVYADLEAKGKEQDHATLQNTYRIVNDMDTAAQAITFLSKLQAGKAADTLVAAFDALPDA